jgi:ABC-type sugar transport system ATPase subunit
VFLFDEPLSNLDATLREQLRVEVKKLHMLLRTTTVFVTHDQLEAMTLADKIVVMRDGRVEQIGTPREVYYAPASLFVARFIGSPPMNFLPMQVASEGTRLVADGLAVALDAAQAACVQPGQAVTLAIRPKDLRLARLHPGAEQHAATVVLSEMMGAETLMQISVGGNELLMVVDDRDTAATGSTIEIVFAPEGLRLFDAASGKAISLAG